MKIISLFTLLFTSACTSKFEYFDHLVLNVDDNNAQIHSFNSDLSKFSTKKTTFKPDISFFKIYPLKNSLLTLTHQNQMNKIQQINLTNSKTKVFNFDDSIMAYYYYKNEVIYSANYLTNNHINFYNLDTKSSFSININNKLVNNFISDGINLFVFVEDRNKNEYLLTIRDKKIVSNTKLQYKINVNDSPYLISNQIIYASTQGLVIHNLEKNDSQFLLTNYNQIKDISNNQLYLINKHLNSNRVMKLDLKTLKTTFLNFNSSIKDFRQVLDGYIIIHSSSIAKYNFNNKVVKNITNLNSGKYQFIKK